MDRNSLLGGCLEFSVTLDSHISALFTHFSAVSNINHSPIFQLFTQETFRKCSCSLILE